MRTRIPEKPLFSADMLRDVYGSLSESVAVILRDAILKGRLKPGDRLVEEHLAGQLGTSRGPVRDAMKQLQQEGLVTITSRRGACVAVHSVEEARQMYGLRSVLEEYAATLAVQHMTEGDLRQLEDYVELMHQDARAEDLHTFLEHDDAFHQLIWERSRHRKLLQVRTQIVSEIRALAVGSAAFFTDLHGLADSHRPIIESLQARQLDMVRKAVHEHVAIAASYWMTGAALRLDQASPRAVPSVSARLKAAD